MIQRKQSLYLLIAALLNADVFYFDLYKYSTSSYQTLLDKQILVNTSEHIRVINHYPALLIAIVMTLLPLATIFMYRKRKQQISMTFVSILAVLSFISMVLKMVADIPKLPISPINESYGLGMILPAISVVFLILAILGIRRDEKLVKSVDRLR